MNKGTSKKVKVPKKADKKTTKKVEAKKFGDLDGKFLHVRVGDIDMPATDKDIKDVDNKLTDLLENNNVGCLVFVTHHAVTVDII